jgi:hypothetical protein
MPDVDSVASDDSKRRLDDIGFPIDAGGFSGACGNIVCNKDCNICCKALRQFWREVCG